MAHRNLAYLVRTLPPHLTHDGASSRALTPQGHLQRNVSLTAPAVTSEILHRGANHSAHPSTYPAATGFRPSHPPVSNRAEVGREVYPAVTRPRGGDPYPSGPRPVVGGLRWGRVYSHKSSRPGLTLSGS